MKPATARRGRLATTGVGLAALLVSATGGAVWAAGAYGPTSMDFTGGVNTVMPTALTSFAQAKPGAPAGQGVITYTATVRLKPGSPQPRLSSISMTLTPVDAFGNAIGPAGALSAGSANHRPSGSAGKAQCHAVRQARSATTSRDSSAPAWSSTPRWAR
jgi:hypothetical protein